MRSFKVGIDETASCSSCGEPAIVLLVMGGLQDSQSEYSCAECWEDTKETIDEEIAEAMKEE